MSKSTESPYSYETLFSKNHIKSTEILEMIKQKKFNAILDGIGHIKDNCIIIEFKFFKYFSMPVTHDLITSHMDQLIKELTTKYDTFNVHVNLQSFSIADADKHSTYCKAVNGYFAEAYPDKLNMCYVYNASFVFETIFKVAKVFMDKDTLKKIVLVKE
jgi:hypothetical protein